jgi:hypothetical protein
VFLLSVNPYFCLEILHLLLEQMTSKTTYHEFIQKERPYLAATAMDIDCNQFILCQNQLM